MLCDAVIHGSDEPCPFASDDNPTGSFGGCCTFRGKIATHELEALGQKRLSARMYKRMTAETAVAFAKRLDDVCDRLERRYMTAAEKPKGAGYNGTWNAKTGEWEWQSHSTFEDAIAAIRKAARWYDKVGKRGFGVYAWY